jgi:phenylpyruvate tautomerase PptA (4-oxalocrotonate tautomerase family)
VSNHSIELTADGKPWSAAHVRRQVAKQRGNFMPLVRISLIEEKSAEYKRKIGDVVHQAMVETINCPPQDRFQLITEHAKVNFLCAPEYLGIPHTDDLIIIQITLNEGRTVELK